MGTHADTGGFRLIPFSFRRKTIRFLVSESVLRRVPCFQEILFRAAASKELVWPSDVVIYGVDEALQVPRATLHMVLPEWLFEQLEEERSTPRKWWKRMLSSGIPSGLGKNLAHCFAFYLAPLQADPRLREHGGVWLSMAIAMPFSYRPVRTTAVYMVVVPVGIMVVSAMLLLGVVFPNNAKLLFARGHIQLAFGRREALSRTRDQLRKMGVSETKLKGLMPSAQLNVIERKESESANEGPQ